MPSDSKTVLLGAEITGLQAEKIDGGLQDEVMVDV